MNEGFIQSNPENDTPETRLSLTVFTEVFSYFRVALLTPMILLYGAGVSIVLVTLWSFVSPGLSLLDLPFGRFLPESFTLGNNSLLQAWGIISLVLYLIQRLIETLTGKKLYLGYLKKMGLQLILLTVMYAFIIIAAHMHLGWFSKGDDITDIMIIFYVITFIATIVLWTVLAPLDLMLFMMRRAQLPQTDQQAPIALPWKKGGFVENILVKILEKMMGQLPSNQNKQ